MWLKDNRISPEELLDTDLHGKLKGWSDPKITLERIRALLDRSPALAIAMEKWSRTGIWVITRTDDTYPSRLKMLLKNNAPPVLYGCGNLKLIDQGGVAVVGSRNASEADLAYSKRLGKLAAASGYSVVSGGARGVDESAMLGALQSEGTSVGVLANDLLKQSTSKKYRTHLQADNLVLLSPFFPEAGFNAGNSMRRNKYIYCLANIAIAVHSGTKGGTWEGAIENIKNDWAPIWIKPTNDSSAGNKTLVTKGAKFLPDELDSIDLANLVNSNLPSSIIKDRDMFSDASQRKANTSSQEIYSNEGQAAESDEEIRLPFRVESSEKLPDEFISMADNNLSLESDKLPLYQLFLLLIQTHASKAPKDLNELIGITQLQKTQLTKWLKQGVSEKKITKLNRPVRYQWSDTTQREMF